ncbi:MAG: hypothetical protein QM630_05475 [Microbacterium sp.]
MGDGVTLKYDDLDALRSELNRIVDEFESAGSRRRDLSRAVGRPYGENALLDAAEDFEGRWDDKRKTLMENCKKVAEHLDAVVRGFKDFDVEAAKKSESRGE